MNSEMEAYVKAVNKHFTHLKQIDNQADLLQQAIPFKNQAGYLLPICKLHPKDASLMQTLGNWRRENAAFFLSKFTVTIENTTEWVQKSILNSQDRLLFLVLDQHDRVLGHMGFTDAVNERCEIEVDNVLRGVKDTERGMMHAAFITMLQWAKENLNPNKIFLRVLHDNHKAIQFYLKAGFVNEHVVPLVKHVEKNMIVYKPHADEQFKAEKYLLHMRLMD